MNPLRLKRNNTFWLGIFLVLFISLATTPIYAQKSGSRKELENKKKKLKEEINNINELLSETKNSKKLSMNQVAILNKKISVREELIATINAEIRAINGQIRNNQKTLEQLNLSLEKLKKEYAKTVYYSYRNRDSYSQLMFVFAAYDFNQAYQRLKYLQQISEYRKKQAEEIKKTRIEIDQKLADLKQKKDEKRALLTNEEVEKSNLAKEKTEQEEIFVGLQSKEKQLKEDLDKKKRDAEALTAAITRLIQEEIRRQEEERKKQLLAKANTEEKTKTKTKKNVKAEEKVYVPELTKEAQELSSDFAANKGKLPWPVVKGVITQGFGDQEHPTIKGFMVHNNGIDISTNRGSNARAVFAGEVTGVTSVPGSGKIIIIRHGEYLSVYSNLNDVNVKAGDKVDVKQSIGNIAFDEDEGKTTVKFQIWKGQRILNPEEWLFQ
jgi:septal ring factor EnvC (AmiA/AmiB activator)